MELHDKAGITHDFLSLRKEPPLPSSRTPSPGHVGGAAAIDLNVVATTIVKPEWSICQPPFQAAERIGGAAVICRRNPYSPAMVDVTRRAADHCVRSGIFPPSSGQNSMDSSSRLKGFADDEEEDEEEFLKDTPSRKGLSIKVDGSSNSGDDRKPSTPRSKHSATEQRRRSKINDRFQILRSLIPNTDQKRDKASFLLEVIEYVQLLQEKVHKYESPYPMWNQDNTKLVPWKSSQTPTDDTVAATATTQYLPAAAEGPAGGFGFFQSQPGMMAGQADHGMAQWAGTSSSVLSDGKEEDLVIDGATISLSTPYSERVLSSLTHALEGLGVDLSQASLSVRINLGPQAIGRELERSSGDDSEQQRRSNKRRPANN